MLLVDQREDSVNATKIRARLIGEADAALATACTGAHVNRPRRALAERASKLEEWIEKRKAKVDISGKVRPLSNEVGSSDNRVAQHEVEELRLREIAMEQRKYRLLRHGRA